MFETAYLIIFLAQRQLNFVSEGGGSVLINPLLKGGSINTLPLRKFTLKFYLLNP